MTPYLAAAAGCAWLSYWASAWQAVLTPLGKERPMNSYVRCSAREFRRLGKGRAVRFHPSRED